MNALRIVEAILAGFGLTFIVFFIIGIARAVREWNYQRELERRYADEWVRRHRIENAQVTVLPHDGSTWTDLRPRDGK